MFNWAMTGVNNKAEQARKKDLMGGLGMKERQSSASRDDRNNPHGL